MPEFCSAKDLGEEGLVRARAVRREGSCPPPHLCRSARLEPRRGTRTSNLQARQYYGGHTGEAVFITQSHDIYTHVIFQDIYTG